LAELEPDQLVAELLPTMFASSPSAEVVHEFGEAMLGTHPAGLRITSRSFAEADVRDVLPLVQVPTLLLYGTEDVRAPVSVANAMHSAIAGSELVMVPGVGHILNVEAPERFNSEVRRFLRAT
jgi:pimeloyl-ACP methyl ester carboxylesterase